MSCAHDVCVVCSCQASGNPEQEILKVPPFQRERWPEWMKSPSQRMNPFTESGESLNSCCTWLIFYVRIWQTESTIPTLLRSNADWKERICLWPRRRQEELSLWELPNAQLHTSYSCTSGVNQSGGCLCRFLAIPPTWLGVQRRQRERKGAEKFCSVSCDEDVGKPHEWKHGCGFSIQCFPDDWIGSRTLWTPFQVESPVCKNNGRMLYKR